MSCIWEIYLLLVCTSPGHRSYVPETPKATRLLSSCCGIRRRLELPSVGARTGRRHGFKNLRAAEAPYLFTVATCNLRTCRDHNIHTASPAHAQMSIDLFLCACSSFDYYSHPKPLHLPLHFTPPLRPARSLDIAMSRRITNRANLRTQRYEADPVALLASLGRWAQGFSGIGDLNSGFPIQRLGQKGR